MIISASSKFHTKHADGCFTPLEMLEHFAEVGFVGCDFELETVSRMGEDWRAQCAAIAEHADRLGIVIGMGHLPYRPVRDAAGQKDPVLFTARMHMSIEAAQILGIKHAVMHPHGKTLPLAELDPEACLRTCIEWTTPFAEDAARRGIALSFENMRSPREAEGYHRWGATAEEIAPLADHFGMGNCWDFGHANTTGVPQGDSLRYLGKRVTTLHVNDNHGTADAHLLPYFGTVDWDDALRGLRDIGYTGPFNYECKTHHLPAEGRQELGRFAVTLARRMCDFGRLGE